MAADEYVVQEVWAVNYSFEPGSFVGVRKEWKEGELVSERETTLDEALPRELHPTIREFLDGEGDQDAPKDAVS